MKKDSAKEKDFSGDERVKWHMPYDARINGARLPFTLDDAEIPTDLGARELVNYWDFLVELEPRDAEVRAQLRCRPRRERSQLTAGLEVSRWSNCS